MLALTHNACIPSMHFAFNSQNLQVGWEKSHIFVSVCVCFGLVFCFLRQGFSLALKSVLGLALIDQPGLEHEHTEIRLTLPLSQVLGLKADATTVPRHTFLFTISNCNDTLKQ